MDLCTTRGLIPFTTLKKILGKGNIFGIQKDLLQKYIKAKKIVLEM